MDSTRNLRVIITATTAQARAELASLSSSTVALGTTMKSVGSEMSALGSGLTRGLTIPIVGAAAVSAKFAIDFQQQMTYVRTQAGDTTDSIDTLSKQVLSLANSSQYGPAQLSEGLYHLASLGLRGADAMNALNTAQELAAVGGADLESTTTALGAALVTGIKGTQDYTQAAGTLNAIIGQGNMRMQDLVGALGSGILPVAKNAGLTLQDVGAALATLTDNGMAADESATRLRMTFALMEAPSKKAQGQLEAIGMTSTQLAMDMRTKGLIPALSDLKQHLLDTYGTTAEGQTKMATALTEIFGGGRSSAAAQTLIEQLDRVQTKYTAIGQTSGQFASDYAQQQETASAKIKTAWSQVQVSAIELGGSLLPTLASALGNVAKFIDRLSTDWNGLTAGQQSFILHTAELLAVLGPGISIIGKFTSTYGTLFHLMGSTIGLFSKRAGAVAATEALTASAGEATIAGGGLAAVLTGPVGIALASTAVLAGGAYMWLRHFRDAGNDSATTLKTTLSPETEKYLKLASDLGVTLKNNVHDTSLLGIAQTTVANDTTLVNAAKKKQNDLEQQGAQIQQTLQQKSQAVADAQANVNAMLKKFGDASPQYADAVDNLTRKQDAYNISLNDSIGNSLSLSINTGNLSQAEKYLKQDTIDLGTTQDYLNGKYQSLLGSIALISPTAQAQIPGIQILANQINGLSISWSSTYANINAQGPQLVNVIQGVGSNLNTIQGQSSAISKSLSSAQSSAKALQGVTISGGSIQGGHLAGGTNYATGGLTLVGEEGPELVQMPRGSKVYNHTQTQAISNNKSISIGTIVLASADAVKEMFKSLDRDNLLLSKGLTTARGMS